MILKSPKWLKRKWIIWSALLLVIGGGISQISLNVDPLRLLPGDLPEVAGLQLFLEHFTKADETIVVIQGEDPDLVSSAAERLAETFRAAPDLKNQVNDRPPWEEPEGLVEVLAFALINLPPDDFAVLLDRLTQGKSLPFLESRLEEMAFGFSPREAMLTGYDPFGLIDLAFDVGDGDSLLSPDSSIFESEDGTLRLIYLSEPGQTTIRGDYREMADRVHRIRSLISETSLPDGVSVRLTGEPPIVSEISRGMERDMKVSGLTTVGMIALIFWFWYRRLRPLAWLVAMLGLIFLITLGLAGIFIRDLTVMNVGFASILIGLSVDYGILIYQATLRNPGNALQVLKECRRGIVWAAATTSVAFGSLFASSLPGVAELGTLVAMGIAAGAAVMLWVFSDRLATISVDWPKAKANEPVSHPEQIFFHERVTKGTGLAVLGFLILCTLTLVTRGLPKVDFSDQSTRPRNSAAYDALDQIEVEVLHSHRTGYLMVSGSPSQVRNAFLEMEGQMADARIEGRLESYTLPTNFVPIREHQRVNLGEHLQKIRDQEARLNMELAETGFSEEAEFMLSGVLRQWEAWFTEEALIFPKGIVAERMLYHFIRVSAEDEVLAAGMAIAAGQEDLRWLQSAQVRLANWDQTMLALRDHIPAELMRILGILILVVIAMLGFTFGRVQEVVWVAVTVALSLTGMLGSMVLFGLTWNFFNLAAILLTVGAGLDYSIHMLLGFRRHRDSLQVQRDVGQALLVCGLSTVVGFGSLAWASNQGLASLGRVCALALLLNALVAIFLLPLLWNWVEKRR